MNRFANLPVQRKLGYAMLLTTTAALVLACGVFLAVEYRSYRRDIEHTVVTLARLTANNSTAAIAYTDLASAKQILDALRAEPQIVSAALYDRTGRLLASFRTHPDEILRDGPTIALARLSFTDDGYVVVVQPVMEGSRRLGTLYLRASMAEIYGRMQSYGWVVLGVLVSSFAIAGLIASQLRQSLARPILELANTANAVAAHQDYSLRARQYGKDELGGLTATFNAMLADTQSAIGALRESEWSHRQLVRALPTAAYMCDAAGRITIYNEAAVALWGRAPEIGLEFWCGSYRIYRPDGTPLPLDQCPMAVALRESVAVRGVEIIIERPDGTRRNVLPHPEPIRDIGGKVVGIVNMLVDITEQKLAGAAASRLAAIVESSDDAIVSKDLNGVITSWNKGAEHLFGYTAAEIVGRSVTLLIPAERVSEEPTILERIRRDEHIEHYETVRRRKDGTLLNVSLTVSPLKDSEGRIIGASKIARDITARKQAEAALRTHEEQLRLVTDTAPVLLTRLDRSYRFTFVNRAYAVRNRSTVEALIGQPLREVIGAAAFECFQPYVDTAFRGERVEFEIHVPYQHIGTRWVHAILVPERNAAGAVIGLLAALNDTSARKETEIELKRARDEALAASRAKDDFLAALSHELRTPLNPVLLLASDAADNPNLPPAVRVDFDLIRKNVTLEARLIDDLLDLTRITRGKLRLEEQRCDLAAILRDAAANVQGELREKHQKLACDLAGKKSIVQGDSVRLQQIFWNILKNAVKFTPDHGRIDLQLRQDADRGRATVRISDTGIGMTPQEIARIFQAFSQGDHAPRGAGSHRFGGLGLGLAITKMLVEMHGGSIEALSDGRGTGSTFVVGLPLAREPAGGTAPAKMLSARPFSLSPLPESGQPAGPARILLVEDHAPTRQTLQQLLRNRNYQVTAAESAAEAQRLAFTNEFDLMISDVGLPDRTGYELMADLRAVQPHLSGIALSGYGMEDDLDRSRAAGFAIHLVKPVTIGMLLDAIGRLPWPAAAAQPAPPPPP